MAGSLLDNEDFSSIGSGGSKKGGGGSVDMGNRIKIGVIAVCLGGAGLLFAYQAGLIFKPKPPTDTRTQEQIEEEDKQFEQQERFREKLKEQPNYQEGDA